MRQRRRTFRTVLISTVALAVCLGATVLVMRTLYGGDGEGRARSTTGLQPIDSSVPAIAPNAVLPDVVYSPVVGMKMDLHYPAAPGPHPVVVWMHGGGWTDGSKDVQPPPDYLLRQMARRNFVVASVDYRLANWSIDDDLSINAFPAAVHDVKTAVRFLKAHASEYALQPDMIVLAGVSAGGHLAALAGTSAAQSALEPEGLSADLGGVDSTVRAVIDVVGISDVEAWGANGSAWTSMRVAAFLGCPRWEAGAPDCPDDRYAAASVGTYVSEQSPPAYLAYGALDPLVPASEHGAPLYRQWAAAKGTHNVVYDLVAGRGHDLAVAGLDQGALDRFIDGVLQHTVA